MSPKSFSSKNVFLAWAAQVSFVQLGARLVAYTDTKATITAFWIAVRHAASKPLGTLPEEMLDLIVQELREMVPEPEQEEWARRMKCLTDTCTPLSHIPLEELIESEFWDGSTANEDLEDEFADDAYNRHQTTREHWSQVLMSLDGNSKFARRVRVSTGSYLAVNFAAYISFGLLIL